jgi:hypothetical protein
MRKNPFKWVIIGGALAVIVMYGLELSTSGIERVYGPVEGGQGYVSVPLQQGSAEQAADDELTYQEKKIAKLERELEELKRAAAKGNREQTDYPGPETEWAEEERLPGIPLDDSQPTVNQLADSTSSLLQNMSSGGIRFIVSIFDGLTE